MPARRIGIGIGDGRPRRWIAFVQFPRRRPDCAAPLGRDDRHVPAPSPHLVLDPRHVRDQPFGCLVRAVDEEQDAARDRGRFGGRLVASGAGRRRWSRHGSTIAPPSIARAAQPHRPLASDHGPPPLPADRGRRCPRLRRAAPRRLERPARPLADPLDRARTSTRRMPASASSSSSTRVAYVGGSIGGGLLTERIGRRVVLAAGHRPHRARSSAGMATVPTWGLFLRARDPVRARHGRHRRRDQRPRPRPLPRQSRPRAQPRSTCSSAWARSPRRWWSGGSSRPGVAWQTVIIGTAACRHPDRDPVRAHGPAVGPPRSDAASGRRPDRAVAAAHRARGRDRLLRRIRGRRLELARPLPRDRVDRAGDVGAGAVLGLPRARAHRDGDARRPVRPRPASRPSRALVAAISLVAAVLVPSLPASIVLFGVVGFAFGPVYPLIMAVGGDRFPTRSAAVSGFLSRLPRHRRDRLPAADGLPLGRGGAGRRDDRGRASWPSPAPRSCSSVAAQPTRGVGWRRVPMTPERTLRHIDQTWARLHPDLPELWRRQPDPPERPRRAPLRDVREATPLGGRR